MHRFSRNKNEHNFSVGPNPSSCRRGNLLAVEKTAWSKGSCEDETKKMGTTFQEVPHPVRLRRGLGDPGLWRFTEKSNPGNEKSDKNA